MTTVGRDQSEPGLGRGTAHTLSHLAYWISEKLCPSPLPQQPRPLFKAELSVTQSESSGMAHDLEGHGRDRSVTLRILRATSGRAGAQG